MQCAHTFSVPSASSASVRSQSADSIHRDTDEVSATNESRAGSIAREHGDCLPWIDPKGSAAAAHLEDLSLLGLSALRPSLGRPFRDQST